MYARTHIYKHIAAKFKSFQKFERQQGDDVYRSILREKRERENGLIIFSQNKR